MFDTKKIDTFFNGDKNLLEEEEKIFITRRAKVVRFFKLFMPCLTALLLGLGVILFDFETNTDNAISLADDEKVYFEKFRMKNTVFELTEKDNQFSVIKASEVEEKDAGSKIYNLTAPDAQTIDKDKTITLTSQKGVYNQKTQVLDLISDVVGNYNNQMKIKTQSATYNFQTESGFGNEKVTGEGEKGSFVANKFTFDKRNGTITLINNVLLKGNDLELKTPHQATLYTNENKLTAKQATVKKANDTLKGDLIIAFFKDMKKFEISKAYSEGHTEIYTAGKAIFAQKGEYSADENLIKLFNNVKISDKSGYTATAQKGIYNTAQKTITLLDNVKIVKDTSTVTAPKAIYFQNKDDIHFYDNVKVVQEDNIATAQTGVYFIKKNVAELNKNVIITKNGNQVHGHRAISDFNTSKSRLIPKEGGRIHGKLIEKSLKKDAKDK